MRLSGRINKVLRDPALTSSGWCVFLLSRDKGANEPRKQLVKVAGVFPGARAGAHVHVDGEFFDHPQYGPQFKARHVREAAPRSSNDLAAFLVNLSVGFTPAEADRLLNAVGAAQAIELLDTQQRDALARAGRMDADMARTLCTAWAIERSSHELSGICFQLGLNRDDSHAIFEHFRERGALAYAPQQVRSNPFVLSAVIGDQFAKLNRMALDVNARLTSPERVDSAITYALELAAQRGHTFMHEDLARRIALELCNKNAPPTEIVPNDLVLQRIERMGQAQALDRIDTERGHYLALPRLADAERSIAADLHRLTTTPSSLEPDAERVRSVEHFTPTDQQRDGFEMVLAHKVSLLTGNPGTGKTTITRQLLAGYPEHAAIRLLAPTGQAADRLSNAAGRDATTIHLALQRDARPSESNPSGQFHADLVIVDEMSMVDVDLARQLLRAIPDGARVVFVGDPEQLPSIGTGSVLRDLIQSELPSSHLTQIVRQAEGSAILDVSARILNGQYPFEGTGGNDALFLPAQNPADAAARIMATTHRLMTGGLSASDIQVLVPMTKGACGTEQLNKRLRSLLNTHSQAHQPLSLRIRASDVRLGDRVRHIRNDYSRGLVNGRIGEVVGHDAEARAIDVDFQGRVARFDLSNANNLQLDYATTIHRSQGSEYPATLVGLASDHKKMLDRRLLYTAVTRAQKLLVLVAEPDALRTAVANNPTEGRQTRLTAQVNDHLSLSPPTRRLEFNHG